MTDTPQNPEHTPNPTPQPQGDGTAAPLNGNEAINRAAEQAQTTAGRNIPALEDLPITADTANLRHGPSLHDGLLALLPLVGVWRGEGQADTPEQGQHVFGQQLTFSHNGENYLTFESLYWPVDDSGEPSGPIQREVGFWRISAQDDIEVTATSSAGSVEILYGRPMNERAWEMQSASTMVTETGPATLGPGKRLFGLLPTGELGWVDERMVDGQLRPRMSAQLKRVIG